MQVAAVEPEVFLPADYFRDQVVIVGFALQAGPEVQSGGADAFVTPYTARTQLLTPGVEVQATIFDNFRNGMTISPVPRWAEILFIALGGILALAAARPRMLVIRFIGAIDTDIFAVGRDGRRIKVGSALMRAHRSTARLDIDGGRQRVAVVALVHVILLLLLVLIILAR